MENPKFYLKEFDIIPGKESSLRIIFRGFFNSFFLFQIDEDGYATVMGMQLLCN